jgi:hypothetical protein
MDHRRLRASVDAEGERLAWRSNPPFIAHFKKAPPACAEMDAVSRAVVPECPEQRGGRMGILTSG